MAQVPKSFRSRRIPNGQSQLHPCARPVDKCEQRCEEQGTHTPRTLCNVHVDSVGQRDGWVRRDERHENLLAIQLHLFGKERGANRLFGVHVEVARHKLGHEACFPCVDAHRETWVAGGVDESACSREVVVRCSEAQSSKPNPVCLQHDYAGVSMASVEDEISKHRVEWWVAGGIGRVWSSCGDGLT
jgi:hypothetical protein